MKKLVIISGIILIILLMALITLMLFNNAEPENNYETDSETNDFEVCSSDYSYPETPLSPIQVPIPIPTPPETEDVEDTEKEEIEEDYDLYPPIPISLTNPQVRWLVEPVWTFDAVFNFSEGMAAVEYFDREAMGWEYEHILGYINRQGEIVIPVVHRHWPGFYSHRGAPPFSHGLVAIQSNYHGGIGIFDTAGNLVVPFSFSDAWLFSEGLMAVRAPFEEDEDGSRTSIGWGFIDTTGELVIDFQFRYASAFREGRAAVLQYGQWGFIDQAGELVIPFQFTYLQGEADSFFLPRFSEGLAAVNIGENGWWDLPESDTLWGYVDIYGNMVISAIYNFAGNFVDGYANVMHEEYGWGFIDREGNFTADEHRWESHERRDIHYGYIDWFAFSEGFSAVALGEGTSEGSSVNKRWGFIDEEGTVVIPVEFHEVLNFSEGLAWVRQGRWWGIIEIVD